MTRDRLTIEVLAEGTTLDGNGAIDRVIVVTADPNGIGLAVKGTAIDGDGRLHGIRAQTIKIGGGVSSAVDDCCAAIDSQTAMSTEDLHFRTFGRSNLNGTRVGNNGIGTTVDVVESTACDKRRPTVVQTTRAELVRRRSEELGREGAALDGHVRLVPDTSTAVRIDGHDGAALDGQLAVAEVLHAAGTDGAGLRGGGVLDGERAGVFDGVIVLGGTALLERGLHRVAVEIEDDVPPRLDRNNTGDGQFAGEVSQKRDGSGRLGGRNRLESGEERIEVGILHIADGGDISTRNAESTILILNEDKVRVEQCVIRLLAKGAA